MSAKKAHMPIADYLSQQIALSGVPQVDISKHLGYDKPNIITMFKQGKTKIPLNKVAPLAEILGIDRIHLLRMAMTEYSPETWSVLEELLGQRLISENEQKLLAIVRKVSDGYDVFPPNDEEGEKFMSMIASWADRAKALAEAAMKPKREQ